MRAVAGKSPTHCRILPPLYVRGIPLSGDRCVDREIDDESRGDGIGQLRRLLGHLLTRLL